MMKQLVMVAVVCLSILAMVAVGCACPEPVTEEPVVEEPVAEEPVVAEPVPMIEVPAPSVTPYVSAEYGFSINFP